MAKSPVNVSLIDTEAFIRQTGAMEVTSSLRTEPTTGNFHPHGLFSETIFGSPTSPERMRLFGYVALNTRIIHPKIFHNLIRLKRFFTSVMSGDTYAYFDNNEKMLVACTEDTSGAGTGYAFFVEHLPKLQIPKSDSLVTQNRVEVLNKFRDNLFIDKWIIIPAGFRDYKEDSSGRGTTDDINKLYGSLINLTKAVNPSAGERPVFDGIRLAIQKRCNSIYEYLNNILAGGQGGKHGFLQHKYGHRALAYGSGNVISAATFNEATVDSPRYHTIDITKIPIVMAVASFQPVVVYQLKHVFMNGVINADHAQASAISPDTYELKYIHIKQKVIDQFVTGKGLAKLIERFKDTHFRNMEVVIPDDEGKNHYMFLVYEDGDKIYLFRNMPEFKASFGAGFDEKKVHPMTYVEMMYIAVYLATKDKFVQITRYPAIEIGSSFITRAYISTTSPSKLVTFSTLGENPVTVTLPDWPIRGNQYVDSTQPHPSRLSGLGGDYDGDQVSNNSIMELKSIEECEAYINSKQYLLEPGGGLSTSLGSDVLKLVLFNMTKM